MILWIKVLFFSFIFFVWKGNALSSDFSASGDPSFPLKVQGKNFLKRGREDLSLLEKGTPNSKKQRLKTEEAPPISIQIPEKNIDFTRVGSQVSILSSFAAKLKKKPSLPEPAQELETTFQDQDCRKLVGSFLMTIRRMLENGIIEAVLPESTNFALARLVFVLKDGTIHKHPLKSFYLSSRPATKNKKTFSSFGELLRNKNLSPSLNFYKEYALNCAQFTFDEQTPHGHPVLSSYGEELENVIKNLQHKITTPLVDFPISPRRMDLHLTDIKENLALHYYHSEQVLRKDLAHKFIHIKNVLEKPDNPIEHVILDVCSYRDICWKCGDFLWMECYGNPEKKMVIRASGYQKYIFPLGFNFDLRAQTCALDQVYTLDPYQPYIAHTHKDILKNDVS